MKIIWAEEAFSAWKDTIDYIVQEFGPHAAEKFYKKTEECQDMLISSPLMGKVEPLLKGRSHAYRSLIVQKTEQASVLHSRRHHIHRRFLGCPARAKATSRKTHLAFSRLPLFLVTYPRQNTRKKGQPHGRPFLLLVSCFVREVLHSTG